MAICVSDILSVPLCRCFFAGRTGDDVAGADFHFLFAPALRPAEARGDDQRLPARMRMPRRARARLGGDALPLNVAGPGDWNSGSMRTAPVNHSAGPLPEGCEPLRLMIVMENSVALYFSGTNRSSSIAGVPGMRSRCG
jgi:hypothetical protein